MMNVPSDSGSEVNDVTPGVYKPALAREPTLSTVTIYQEGNLPDCGEL